METAVAMLDSRRLTECGFDVARRAFLEQHGDDLPGRSVAEQLAESFFMPGNSVTVDQGDEPDMSPVVVSGEVLATNAHCPSSTAPPSPARARAFSESTTSRSTSTGT